MKSIKEKAEESSMEYDKVQASAIGKGFVLGANYVLDEIEEIIKYDKDPHCIEFLKERIWRLKYESKQNPAIHL